MKKILICLVLFISCFSIASAQCDTVEVFDVYTPIGNAVEAWLLTCDLPITDRIYWDSFFQAWYPNAVKIVVYDGVSSTQKFNCHGYAWWRVEKSIDRWIGRYSERHSQSIFMTDGSYIEVSEETYPAKVSYVGGDHSAITTEVEGWVISKWSYGPLMFHQKEDCPQYTSTVESNGFKYFVKNCDLQNADVDYKNETVIMNNFITSCGNINAENITVTNGATLTLEAAGNINIQNVNVTNGAKLILEAAGNIMYGGGLDCSSGGTVEVRK